MNEVIGGDGMVAAPVTYAQRLDQESLDSVTLVEAAEQGRADGLAEKGIYQTEKGVVLKFKKFPVRLVLEATNRLTEPKPPMVFIEDKNRHEENPSDPQYLEDKRTYGMKLVDTLTRVNLGFGTEVVGLGDCPGPDTLVWSSDLTDLIGMEIPAVGTKGRYVAWLQWYVLSDVELNELGNALLTFNTGVRVEDVKAAEASFPGVSGGDVATGDATPADSEQPDSSGGTTGADTGVRAEGSSPVLPDPVDDVPVAGV